MYDNRFVYDVLYGKIVFPEYVWSILLCPELQRLREVRLCNINSFCLTGGANINRYEHSIGTTYIALKCLDAWPGKIDNKVKRIIILAGLLHDIGTTAFGHSVEYILDSSGYKHDSIVDILGIRDDMDDKGGYNYQYAKAQPIYFGVSKRLTSILPLEELRAIGDIIAGKGPYGPLISGSIDLDNIDNVYRLAYHIGLTRSATIPLKLAQSIYVDNGKLFVRENATRWLKEWYNLRRILYNFLLLNPDEFSAKCMLEEALGIAQSRSTISFSWNDVDYQLLDKLSKCSDDTAMIVSRLMMGDLYGCVGIYSTQKLCAFEMLTDIYKKSELEKDLAEHIRGLKSSLKSAVIALHAIKDINKTQRQIEVLTTKGNIFKIGTPTKRVLIGVFFKNVHLSMTSVNPKQLKKLGIQALVKKWLANQLKDNDIQEFDLYSEAKYIDN